MKTRCRTALIALATCVGVATPVAAADPGVALIGVGAVPGSALDRSGLEGESICKADDSSVCVDQATLGGFGSAMTYTGHDNADAAARPRGASREPLRLVLHLR
ncbi:MAG: hypothetical protein ABI895_06440 [Deltaproteobacteria bacterium]